MVIAWTVSETIEHSLFSWLRSVTLNEGQGQYNYDLKTVKQGVNEVHVVNYADCVSEGVNNWKTDERGEFMTKWKKKEVTHDYVMSVSRSTCLATLKSLALHILTKMLVAMFLKKTWLVGATWAATYCLWGFNLASVCSIFNLK